MSEERSPVCRGQDEEKKPAKKSAQEWPVRKEHGVIKLSEKIF